MLTESEIRAFVTNMTPGDLFNWLVEQPGSREFVCYNFGRCLFAEMIAARTGARILIAAGYAIVHRPGSDTPSMDIYLFGTPLPDWVCVTYSKFDRGAMGTNVSSIIDFMLTKYDLPRPARNASMLKIPGSGLGVVCAGKENHDGRL